MIQDFSGREVKIGSKLVYASKYRLKSGIVDKITITKWGTAVRIKLDKESIDQYGSSTVVLRDGKRFVNLGEDRQAYPVQNTSETKAPGVN